MLQINSTTFKKILRKTMQCFNTARELVFSIGTRFSKRFINLTKGFACMKQLGV
jgi:hypothetical protein